MSNATLDAVGAIDAVEEAKKVRTQLVEECAEWIDALFKGSQMLIGMIAEESARTPAAITIMARQQYSPTLQGFLERVVVEEPATEEGRLAEHRKMVKDALTYLAHSERHGYIRLVGNYLAEKRNRQKAEKDRSRAAASPSPSPTVLLGT